MNRCSLYNISTVSYTHLDVYKRQDKALQRAIEVLESVREEGQDKAEWNMRMAYGLSLIHI